MLRPLLGLELDGATLAEVDERGGLGTPAWGPVSLLRDLEMRLGLRVTDAPHAVRVHQWSARLAARLGTNPFYARSYAVDAEGTAEMLLAWRDGLVDSGWDGSQVPGGGPRLDAFAALEALAEPRLYAGAADRLAAVEAELARGVDAPYEGLTFADDRGLWPRRWQRIFEMLAAAGTRMTSIERPAQAWGATDLGRLQAQIAAGEAAGATATARIELHGDGSLVLLRAPTTLEAAHAVAALVRAAGNAGDASVAIIRPAAALLLDDALDAHGAGPLGVRASSRWRAALQLLPLAVELLFEPRDPRRALELLGLAVSPFAHLTRHIMSRALSDAPGIGDVRWQAAKQRVREHLAAGDEPDAAARAAREVALIEEWLEPVRYGARDGAPKAAVLAVAMRARDWLRLRQAGGGLVAAVATIAAEQCDQLIEILEGDPRETLDLVAVRQRLDAVTAAGAGAELSVERVGRVDHVDHPGALRCRRDLVIWWHFVAETARPPHRARWRRPELDALAAGGVVPPDPIALLAEESRHWRSAVLAARHRLVLVLPETDRGERMSPHPLWDEIVARLGLDEPQLGRITVTVADLLARPRFGLAIEALPPLALPAARPTWRVPAGVIGPAARFTASSLQALLECPLRWVLGHAASLHAGSAPALPEHALLDGILGHRLIEVLVDTGGLASPGDEVARVFDRLLPGVAASLLQPGMASELHQLRRQLVSTVEALAALLHRGELTIAAAEEEIAATWLGAELVGRIDLRLRDRTERDVVLDFKWGHGSHRDRLARGRAVQLATYAHARRLQAGVVALPAAGYFSLSRGRLLTTDAAAFGAADGIEGPALDETVERIAATVPVVQRALAEGQVAVTGVGRSRPLLEALGVPAAEHGRHYESAPGDGCAYCPFDVLCGRAWEARS